MPELFLPAVAPGQKITLEIDAYPGQAFTGEVRALNPLVDAAGRAVVVRAEIDNDEGKLRPGLFARVRLTLAERQNALFVPEQAIQPQGDQAFVFKVVDAGDGKTVAKLTPVDPGQPSPGRGRGARGPGGRRPDRGRRACSRSATACRCRCSRRAARRRHRSAGRGRQQARDRLDGAVR